MTAQRKQPAPYPAIPTLTIKRRRNADILIDASVSLSTGSPTVDFTIAGYVSSTMTSIEARRVGAALIKAADCCDAKTAYCKYSVSTPGREESKPAKRRRSR